MAESLLRIEPIDVRDASDREYAAMSDFENRMRAERHPEDPPIPLEENVAGWRNTSPILEFTSWGVWTDDGSQIIASGSVSFWKTEENQHLVHFHVGVLPEFRRQGIARRLLRLIVEMPVRENRTLMITGTNERVPSGEAFMNRLGAENGLAEHTNQLVLSDLNRQLIHEWQERARHRATDFELVFYDGPYPEEDIEAIAQLFEVMNTAPRGNLQIQDFRMRPEYVRQWEKSTFARGTQRWALFARQKSTGKLAGFTDTFWNPNRPHILQQGGTGVLPEFRNLGLGRWLKANMLERVLRGRRTVRFLRTGNADSNAPMLKINVELGFKPYISHTAWQIETAKVLGYLESSDRG